MNTPSLPSCQPSARRALRAPLGSNAASAMFAAGSAQDPGVTVLLIGAPDPLVALCAMPSRSIHELSAVRTTLSANGLPGRRLKARYTYPRDDGPFKSSPPSRTLTPVTLVPLRCGAQSTCDDWKEATTADSLAKRLILIWRTFGAPRANARKALRSTEAPGTRSLTRYGPAPIGVS